MTVVSILPLHYNPRCAAQNMADHHLYSAIAQGVPCLISAHTNIDKSDHTIDLKHQQVLFGEKKIPMPLPGYPYATWPRWVREKTGNYRWMWTYLKECVNQSGLRTQGKDIHPMARFISILEGAPKGLVDGRMSVFPLCLPNAIAPELTKYTDPVESYRNYYRVTSTSGWRWTGVDSPEWMFEPTTLNKS